MNPNIYELSKMTKEQYDFIMKRAELDITCLLYTSMSYKGNVFGVEPPTFVELEVVDTEPGFAGNTSTNATKPATLETGATIQVPLFVDMNEVIRVDTRTGEYMERVK